MNNLLTQAEANAARVAGRRADRGSPEAGAAERRRICDLVDRERAELPVESAFSARVPVKQRRITDTAEKDAAITDSVRFVQPGDIHWMFEQAMRAPAVGRTNPGRKSS
jgi:hypothetical protein